MSHLIGAAVLASLLLAAPATALRGVQPGATCVQAEQVERKLGSKRHGSSSSKDKRFFFDGNHLGQEALISYGCESRTVTKQLIAIKFADENEARVEFEDFKRALAADHGQPYKDADEPTISDMREDPQFGLPVERFVVWVIEKRVITLMLSGQGSSWELVVQGP